MRNLIEFLAKNELPIRRLLNLDKVLFLRLIGLKVGRRVLISRSSSWPLRMISHIKIEDDVIIGKHTLIGVVKTEYPCPSLVIKRQVGIGDNCRIGCARNVFIGEGTLIADNVTIQDCEHTFEKEHSACTTPIVFRGTVYIGANCFIGRNVVILPGTFLASGSIVGANSVVKGIYQVPVRLVGQKATIK